jgi:hypothetical protein
VICCPKLVLTSDFSILVAEFARDELHFLLVGLVAHRGICDFGDSCLRKLLAPWLPT